jgi:chromosome segregation ATPase
MRRPFVRRVPVNPIRFYEGPYKGEYRSNMEKGEELDQFQLLEEKLDNLIGYVDSLKKEKEALAEKVQINDNKIADLTGEIEILRSARDQAKQRIISLLEKIDQVNV